MMNVLKSGKINRWHHFALHIAFVLVLSMVVAPQYPAGQILPFIFYKFISLVLILLPVYINLYLLFPYFKNRNKWMYTGVLLTLIVVFTLLNYLRFQWIDPAYVPAYVRFDYPEISIFFLFFSLVMITGTAMLLKIIRLFQQQNVTVHQLKQYQLESELQFLKLQISPHFYFNIMNSIYHSIKIDPEQAERIVLQLSDIMKYHIYDCRKDKVELEHEVQNLNNYIGLQKMRLSSDPVINIEVTGDLNQKFIAPFILLTFVENAFKHGLEKQSKKPTLHIQLSMTKNEMRFQISNSKPDFGTSIKAASGNGLINVKKRLELSYPLRHELLIEDQQDRYEVDLKIQLN
ncbi:MAG: histidine kinase [Chitinophagales bacterium]